MILNLLYDILSFQYINKRYSFCCSLALITVHFTRKDMDNSESSQSFGDLGLKQEILDAVEKAGFTTPSPIQAQAIPQVLAGVDIIAQAQTGTGKTAAFCLPALHNMEDRAGITLLVITPTRELAQQVCGEFNRFGKGMGMKATSVYGGQSISLQLKRIREGVQAIVATPGRLLDFLRSKKLQGFSPTLVVLDEADEMLDMGFLEDIQSIFSFLPKKRQTLFFSATIPKPIQRLAQQILKDPVFIKTLPKKKSEGSIEQIYYLVKESEREAALIRLIDSHSPSKALVFCRTKKEVDRLSNYLLTLGYPVRTLHGDMEQKQRQDAIHSFRRGSCKLLIATDIAGRGLDIPDISHVFNYHIPFTNESHTHRIGRTGRAGKNGIAITLVSPSELSKVRRILNLDPKKMKLCSIPTLTEAIKKRQHDFIQKVKDRQAHEHAQEVLNQLQSEMDMHQLSIGLLSMLLDEQKLSGPEKIGLSPHELKDIAKSGPKRNRNRSRDRNPRPRRGGFQKKKFSRKR